MTSPATCAASATPSPTCCLASRWKEDMAFPRSFYVADDIWRFAWSLVGCLLRPLVEF